MAGNPHPQGAGMLYGTHTRGLPQYLVHGHVGLNGHVTVFAGVERHDSAARLPIAGLHHENARRHRVGDAQGNLPDHGPTDGVALHGKVMHTQKSVFKVVGTREAKLAQGRGDTEGEGLRDGLEHFALLVDQCMVFMPPEDKHRADAVLGEHGGAHDAGARRGKQRAHLETGSCVVAHDTGLVNATGPFKDA